MLLVLRYFEPVIHAKITGLEIFSIHLYNIFILANELLFVYIQYLYLLYVFVYLCWLSSFMRIYILTLFLVHAYICSCFKIQFSIAQGSH